MNTEAGCGKEDRKQASSTGERASGAPLHAAPLTIDVLPFLFLFTPFLHLFLFLSPSHFSDRHNVAAAAPPPPQALPTTPAFPQTHTHNIITLTTTTRSPLNIRCSFETRAKHTHPHFAPSAAPVLRGAAITDTGGKQSNERSTSNDNARRGRRASSQGRRPEYDDERRKARKRRDTKRDCVQQRTDAAVRSARALVPAVRL